MFISKILDSCSAYRVNGLQTTAFQRLGFSSWAAYELRPLSNVRVAK